MKIEMSINGENVTIELSMEEASQLHSFLEYHTREKLDEEIVTEEEYLVAETVRDELLYYLGE